MTPRTVKSWAGKSVEQLRERWGRDHVYAFGKVDSTNDAARELAEEEDVPSRTVVVAREQREGKGRKGRSWHSPAGKGLYLSMVFRPDTAGNPEILPLVAGLGLVRQLDRAFPGLEPRVKWPNDLMVDDRKAGGVLSEAAWSEGGVRFLVVGIGINVRELDEEFPEELRDGATSLEDALGKRVALVDVADAAVEGLDASVPGAPERLEGALLEELDRYDWLQDRRVLVTLPEEDEDEPLPGVCVGIAPDGALLFRPDRGALRRLHSATVEAEG